MGRNYKLFFQGHVLVQAVAPAASENVPAGHAAQHTENEAMNKRVAKLRCIEI